MVTAVFLFISTRKFTGNFDVIPMIIKLLKISLSAMYNVYSTYNIK